MEFEFDEAKSKANAAKHGIDFIGNKHYSAVITHREGRTRIISVRRSRAKEVAIYESE